MGEIIFEIVGGFALVGLGFVLGAVVFALVRTGRWALLRSERSTPVTDRHGGRWTVRIPLAPTSMRFWASSRLLKMTASDRRHREMTGTLPDGVSPRELAHPKMLVEDTEEASPFVAVFMIAVVVLALLVFVVEAVVVVLVAAFVAAVRVTWGRWQCEVVAPDHRRASVSAGSLRDARIRAAQLVESIRRDGQIDEPLG